MNAVQTNRGRPVLLGGGSIFAYSRNYVPNIVKIQLIEVRSVFSHHACHAYDQETIGTPGGGGILAYSRIFDVEFRDTSNDLSKNGVFEPHMPCIPSGSIGPSREGDVNSGPFYKFLEM